MKYVNEIPFIHDHLFFRLLLFIKLGSILLKVIYYNLGRSHYPMVAAVVPHN